jgi:hypothetical protein
MMRRSRLVVSLVSIGLCMLVLAAVAQACDVTSVGAAGPGGGAARPGDTVTFNIGMTGDPGPSGARWTLSIDTGSGYHEVASGVSNGTTSGSFTMPDAGNSPRTVGIAANLENADHPDGSHVTNSFQYQPAPAATSQPAAQAPTPQHSSASGGSTSASGSPARTSPSTTGSQPTRHTTAAPRHAAVPTSSSTGSGSSAQGQAATSAVATSADATSAQSSLTSSAPAARAAAAAHQARAGQSLLQSADRVQAGAAPLVRRLRTVSSGGVPAGVAIPVGLLLLSVLGAGTYLLVRRGGSPPLEVGAPITPPAPEPTPTEVTAPLSLEDELDQLVAAGSATPSVAAATAGDTQSKSPAREDEQAELLR